MGQYQMLRLVLFFLVIISFAMFSGCKMCASYTDITGSPVANAMAGEGMRAGSQFGGYSGGGYYVDGYQSTANPQQTYDSEFTRSSMGAKTIQTSQNPSTNNYSRGNVVPANYYSSR